MCNGFQELGEQFQLLHFSALSLKQEILSRESKVAKPNFIHSSVQTQSSLTSGEVACIWVRKHMPQFFFERVH